MSRHRAIATFKRILFGMIALALVLAPVQAASTGKANAAMSNMKMIAKTDCPQKKNCCDKEKSVCPSPKSCMVQCSASFATLNSVESRLFSFNAVVVIRASAISPDSMAPPPLRRPPRI